MSVTDSYLYVEKWPIRRRVLRLAYEILSSSEVRWGPVTLHEDVSLMAIKQLIDNDEYSLTTALSMLEFAIGIVRVVFANALLEPEASWEELAVVDDVDLSSQRFLGPRISKDLADWIFSETSKLDARSRAVLLDYLIASIQAERQKLESERKQRWLAAEADFAAAPEESSKSGISLELILLAIILGLGLLTVLYMISRLPF